MKALLVLLSLLLSVVAQAGRGRDLDTADDNTFLASLLGGGGDVGAPSDSSTGSQDAGLTDQELLNALLGVEGGGPTQKPKCSTSSDVTSLSDEDFILALQGGCGPDEETPTLEPGTPCERGEFQCTPYHRCLEQDIVSDGLGVFDMRIGLPQFQEESDFITHSECPRFGDVCCRNPQFTTPEPDVTEPPYVPQCGQRHENGLGARITGFKEHESQFGELPWIVAIVRLQNIGGEEKRLFVCAGSLIHPQIVLTAAHCVDDVGDQRLVARLGEWDVLHESELFAHVDMAVDEVRLHPDFHPRLLRDDVALLVLAEPAPLQAHIDTLCLPTPGVNYDRAQCVVAGWGKDAMGDTGKFQTVLKLIEMSHVPRAPCQAALRKTRLRKYFRLDRSFTCAGGEQGQDACQGDGGAPLACRDPLQPDRWVQVGVVSWGVDCGLAGVPGVYADVRRQVDWISQIAREVEQRQVDLTVFERTNPVRILPL